jgi:hypothetical protein
MDVYLSGHRHRCTDAELLGEGGEARVYRVGDRAVKLYHPPADAKARAELDRKLEKLAQFPVGLPAAVVAPLELARSARGEVLGYAMALVPGATGFERLSSRKWREGTLRNAALMQVFRQLHATVDALHTRRVTIGDFNDGNVLLAGDGPHLIDADSFQFGAFVCPVAHERFLDPRLYGVDLARAPSFTDGSDWYAFAVLLFSSLLYVHPFGGTHATHATLLRRAEARHSVFQSDVVLPRLGSPISVLPDDLNHWFRAVFERDARQPFPASLLDLPWASCACGVEHARSVCPSCHALGPLVARQVLRARGRCTARTAFETSGRVLHAAMSGGLRYVFEEDGTVKREDGEVVTRSRGPNTRYAIAGRATWVADEQGRVEKVLAGQVVERAQTTVRQGTPVLGAQYRQEQGWLIDSGTGARVGQVLEGQTWLWSGDRLALGFYRVGGLTVAFLVRHGRAGLKHLPEVGWQGRVVDADAVFDDRHALLSVTVDVNGRDQVKRWLFDEHGVLHAASTDGVAGHAALLAGRVVLATDQGLMALKIEQGVLLERAVFTDTQPFVSAGDELLPTPDGSLYVVGARDIVQLTLT